ncbi:hypothetical protein ABF176_002559 [Flavobacterium psychrophilum]|uniref:Tail specific protease domain-containing protein n=1 Tax=Flavobacterium psychrophilum TaxID=96345 RepID=A0A7U2NH02_FLAPS|nr:S41 family peptidase [Flavobacterium psychrophilum]ELM3645182.1 hypothetical protein [Flavobacterium psychrophilum]OAE90386.1 hypothetical protein SU65_11640 [Flavobacterium psychrophilum]QRE04858.1 hypothetical protein H0H26_04520 [Flavobacterium psychrophilum]
MKKIILILLISTFKIYGQDITELKKFTKTELQNDFDIAVNALKEAHPGLYWYTTFAQFDSLCNNQKLKIEDNLNALDFYRILAPIIVATKEGHCKISLSDDIDEYFSKYGKYPPVFIKFFEDKPYIINDIDDLKIKGNILSKINGRTVNENIETIFNTISSDGYNLTKKYQTINGQDFSYYYSDVFNQSNSYELEVIDPKTNKTSVYTIRSVSEDWLEKQWNGIDELYFNKSKISSSLTFSNNNKTALLTYNTFKSDKYNNFKKITDDYFKKILQYKVTDLIIDLRNNGGGEEGFEDYVFSYLTNKPYKKYKYVQSTAFLYSFYKFTDRNTIEKQKSLENALQTEQQLESDGRILRKPNILIPEKTKNNSFKGNLYILISGSTYSGGSEFASLIKGHRKSTFIGEECGGGFYGNTSGFSIELTLPNSKLHIKIPLLKFVVDVNDKNMPLGRGVLPDYEVQPNYENFINGRDTEIEFTKKLIEKK